MAAAIGLEKVVMKQGKFIGYFISDQQSPFYQSVRFNKVLQFVQLHPGKLRMKEKQTRNGLRLLLTMEGVTTIDKAQRAVAPLYRELIPVTEPTET
jgi:transcription-repair coupling factor (superfamily II helicase)